MSLKSSISDFDSGFCIPCHSFPASNNGRKRFVSLHIKIQFFTESIANLARKWILKVVLSSFIVLSGFTQVIGQARLVTPVESVIPEIPWFGLSLEITEGWNTYWKNAGSTGLPPSIELSDGQQSYEPELQFPVAKTKPFGDDVSLLTYGYTDVVLHPFQITVPLTASDQWSLSGEARWLVCRDICIPESQEISISLPVVSSQLDVRRSRFVQQIDAARAAVPTDFPASANFAGPQSVWISGLTEVAIQDVMPEGSGEVLGLIERVEPLGDGVLVTFDRVLNPSDYATGHWVIGVESGGIRLPLDRLLAVPLIDKQNLSLGVVLIMALAGGLILNLMPCVSRCFRSKHYQLQVKRQKNGVMFNKELGSIPQVFWPQCWCLLRLWLA